MKYVKVNKFWEQWEKNPEWMIVNKAGRVVKVSIHFGKEYYEKEIEENIRIFRYLAKHQESARWLQVNSPDDIPDDLFHIEPYDEKKCMDSGILEISSEEEYNKIFYPRGKVNV